jgi:hypothetical protein
MDTKWTDQGAGWAAGQFLKCLRRRLAHHRVAHRSLSVPVALNAPKCDTIRCSSRGASQQHVVLGPKGIGNDAWVD